MATAVAAVIIDMPRMITTQNRSLVETQGMRFAGVAFISAANRIVIIRGMRRFLIGSFFTLALLISAVGAAPAAHAECLQDPGDSSIYLDGDTGNPCTADQITTGDFVSGAEIDPTAAGTPVTSELGKDMGSQFGTVMTWIMTLFAWLVGVAALTLDNAVYYTVVKMGSYVNSLSAIGVTWRILRDIANIMLIFGFLGAGIATILNVDQYGWKTKMLPMLFVGAIFLNFSLFITEAMIDGTNLFATQFYQQINGGQPAGVKSFDPGFSVRLRTEGISNKLMSQLGLATIYGEASTNKEIFKAGNTWVIGFMAILLFIVTAFVMFALAFILIARFVALVFFIILSPVGFMGLAIPQMQYRAKQWWTHFLEQIITAPILMLLLYVALAVITDAQFLTGLCIPSDPANPTCTPNVVGWVSGNFQGFASFILSFLVAMGLLLVVVIKAKSMSAFGAAGASKLAGKLTFGATAFGLRHTAGWGFNTGARMLRKTSVGRVPVIGRALIGALDRGGKASYDVRGTSALKNMHIDAGEAQKGGYTKELEEAIKGREEHAKHLELTKTEKDAIPAAEEAAEAAKDAYERNKTPATRLAMKQAQKAASDAKGAAQLGYAKGLERMPWGWLYRNSKGAANIRKTVEKSSDQKTIDALVNTINRNAGVPPPPPPGGGGGGGGAPPHP